MHEAVAIAFFVTCRNRFLHEQEKGKEIGGGWKKEKMSDFS